MNTTAYKKSDGCRPKLEVVVSILIAGFLATLPVGCAQPAGTVAQTPGPIQAPMGPKARELVTIEVTQAGDIVGVWIGSIPVSRERYTRAGRPIRQYQFGTAKTADPAHPSSVCISDESAKERVIFCWPNDRHAWIQLAPGFISAESRLPSPDAGNIKHVYFQSDREKRSVPALAPLGTPTPIPGKVLSYQQLLDDPCWCCWVDGAGNPVCINLCELRRAE
jgi:hypothetical protein